MKTLPILLIAILASSLVNAQNKKKQDANAIKQMCGCFEVTFNFAETFEYSDDSLYNPSKPKVASALEWAQLITDESDKVSIQHLLLVGHGDRTHIVKHWRQDWLYENTDFYMYNTHWLSALYM
ncbi:MAG: DUF6607 family protein, partial [Bacteroidota bacterium]